MNYVIKKKNFFVFFFIILLLMFLVTSGTYAYLFYTTSNNSIISGNMGKVDLELEVIRILPEKKSVNSSLLFKFDELASNLNKGCIDPENEYSLCQLYKINLKNKSGGVNVRLKGGLSFNNSNMPNLSWILLGNSYSSSVNYTKEMLGNTFNIASSNYVSFVDDYLLMNDNEETFYILIWINEINEIQYDSGSYSGIVRFEDSNGNGVSAEFRG